jgi:hypothetical protein
LMTSLPSLQKTKRKRKGNKHFCLKRDTACERLYQDLPQAVSFD